MFIYIYVYIYIYIYIYIYRGATNVFEAYLFHPHLLLFPQFYCVYGYGLQPRYHLM